MREVGGAVKRIDVPAEFGRTRLAAAFFSHDRVGGVQFLQALDDEPFARTVGFGHQVEFAFELESDVAREVAVDQGSGFACDSGCGFEVGRQCFELLEFKAVLTAP